MVELTASSHQTIEKPQGALRSPPNLLDYEAEQSAFSWDDARADLFADLGLDEANIAYAAVTRHVTAGRGHHIALRWIDRGGERHNYSYNDLDRLSSRFCNVLQELGIEKGDRIFTLASRIPELYITALGAWKRGAVFCPLFSAFGPEPIQTRMSIAEGKLLLTTQALYRRKIAQIRDQLPELANVLLAGEGAEVDEALGLLSWQQLMDRADESCDVSMTHRGDPAILHFTSGTTGTPKGALHVHDAVVGHYVTGRYALDLQADDVCWCTADPGWVTGTSYGIVAPLVCGVTLISDEAEFDAARWYQILDNEKVSVWYTAPTAIRMLMKSGTELARDHNYARLRFMASVGEPLSPDCVRWGLEAFGLPFHDNWWQTETGAIMIANFAGLPIKPGSMGLPIPGIDVGIVEHRGDELHEITASGQEGELAIRPGWPSMFQAYINNPERYETSFQGGWYLTGDLAKRDDDGYYWFVGRADDVIKSAGHLIGPFEVESSLAEHELVLEAGVIGKPDPIAGAVVKAFVVLKEGAEKNDATLKSIMAHARKTLGPAVAPREIEFVADLPKTRSGKIMRRLLKARELGLPEGDISALETGV